VYKQLTFPLFFHTAAAGDWHTVMGNKLKEN